MPATKKKTTKKPAATTKSATRKPTPAATKRTSATHVKERVRTASRQAPKTRPSMEVHKINPWSWQDNFGFSQGIEFSGHQRVLMCAGQTSIGPDGQPRHAGDMKGQLIYALDNLQTVLRAADMTLSNVVRLNFFTTNPDALFEHYGIIAERLRAAKSQPASTLLGVARLAFPELMIEMEATAVA